jgi:hypothetical protein
MPMHDSDKSEFSFNYLPASVAGFFRDALGSYRHGLLQAFAAMCRLTAQAIFSDLGEGTKLKIFDQVEEIAQLANIDDQAYRNIRNILFDTDSKSIHEQLDRETAAVLLETMKDVLHQSYIRRGVLRKKLRMRRFFASQSDEILEDGPADETDPKISQFRRPTGTN